MLPATQTIEFCSTDLDKEVVHLLNYARTKLLTEMPRQLKMTSYLRLCCLAIRKLRQKPRLAGEPSLKEVFDDSYSHLLQALCDRNPEWWRHCWSSDRGILKSDDPTIDKLLQPLEYFVEIYTCKYSSNQKSP
ncbi:MAG: hypothetical protein N4J56_007204 [Chroococcidiopsis sp. SAG 2025]|nr:hypothetical protein [Chroococcidiopsis sp. SAG 2025]